MPDIRSIAADIALIGPRIGRRILADTLRGDAIPPAQMFVILMLAHGGPCRACDIGRELRIAAPTATGIVNRLVRSGYVARTAAAHDRRCVTVTLTAKGRRFSDQMMAMVTDRWTEILSKISPADARQYRDILQKINEVL